MRHCLFHSYQKICWYVKIYWIKMTEIPGWSNWADGGIISHGKAQGQVCHMFTPCFDPFQNVILLSFMIKTGNSTVWAVLESACSGFKVHGLKSHFHYLLPLWSWVSRFIFLCFSILIYKLGIIVEFGETLYLNSWAHTRCSINESHFY